jgi:hypothetical protein
VVAVAGTRASIRVSVQLMMLPATRPPLESANDSVLPPWVAPKFVPVTTTTSPGHALGRSMPVMVQDSPDMTTRTTHQRSRQRG